MVFALKYVILVAILINLIMAQRPGYLAGASYPELASRFRTDSTRSASTPGINNRLGGTTARIPIDARGDTDLVKRLKSWPRGNMPYWLVNADHLERHRNTRRN